MLKNVEFEFAVESVFEVCAEVVAGTKKIGRLEDVVVSV